MSFGTMSKSNVADQIAEALGKTLVCATGRNLSPQAAGHLQRAAEKIAALSRGHRPAQPPLPAAKPDPMRLFGSAWRAALRAHIAAAPKPPPNTDGCVELSLEAVLHLLDCADTIETMTAGVHTVTQPAGWIVRGTRDGHTCHTVDVEGHTDDGLPPHIHRSRRAVEMVVALPKTKAAAEAAFPAATIFTCRVCANSVAGTTDGAFAGPGWRRLDGIDGPNAICPACAADPTSLETLRNGDEYPNVRLRPEASPKPAGWMAYDEIGAGPSVDEPAADATRVVEHLSDSLAEARADLSTASVEASRLRAERDLLTKERDALRSYLAPIRAERDKARQELNAARARCSKLQEANNELTATLDRQMALHGEDLRRIETLTAERDTAQAELAKLSDTVIGVATGASDNAFATAIAECEEALAQWDQGNGKPMSDALRAAIAAMRGAP